MVTGSSRRLLRRCLILIFLQSVCLLASSEPFSPSQSSVSQTELIASASERLYNVFERVGSVLNNLDSGRISCEPDAVHELKRVNMNLMGVKSLLWQVAKASGSLPSSDSSSDKTQALDADANSQVRFSSSGEAYLSAEAENSNEAETQQQQQQQDNSKQEETNELMWTCSKPLEWGRRQFYNPKTAICERMNPHPELLLMNLKAPAATTPVSVSTNQTTTKNKVAKQSSLLETKSTRPMVINISSATETRANANVRMAQLARGMKPTYENFYERSPWFRTSFQACQESSPYHSGWCHRHVGMAAEPRHLSSLNLYNSSVLSAPSSGEHRPVWAKWGEYSRLYPERWIHNLEHGGIVFLYHPCASQDIIDQLRFLAKSQPYPYDKGGAFRYILTPYPKLKSAFALASWQHLFEGDCLNAPSVTAAAREFIETRYRRAREDLSWDGTFNENWVGY